VKTAITCMLNKPFYIDTKTGARRADLRKDEDRLAIWECLRHHQRMLDERRILAAARRRRRKAGRRARGRDLA
jgi:hypothetical protein